VALLEEFDIYDEFVEVLLSESDPDRLLAFQLSAEKQQRLEELLEKNRGGTLSPGESHELNEFERLEHVVRMLKASIRKSRQA